MLIVPVTDWFRATKNFPKATASNVLRRSTGVADTCLKPLAWEYTQIQVMHDTACSLEQNFGEQIFYMY